MAEKTSHKPMAGKLAVVNEGGDVQWAAIRRGSASGDHNRRDSEYRVARLRVVVTIYGRAQTWSGDIDTIVQ